jgi:hypothetical protein
LTFLPKDRIGDLPVVLNLSQIVTANSEALVWRVISDASACAASLWLDEATAELK